ncbi:MAG: ureidoglycolate lyase [Leptolyngbyaceae cyanobacterium bins.349]|nr:ureidoglycolate lyase [Leptolyngbyaceae cyanobacterium bins.349]
METYLFLKLHPQPITPEAFQPFGQMIVPTEDGASFDATNAQLNLQNGIPRFYIMRLYERGMRFNRITRHQKVTQCLGSLADQEWFIAVAPPSQNSPPDWEQITAFQIPGNCFIKLNVGTWHAGPYFEVDAIDFYNLELSDTNIVDHDTCNLLETYGVEYEIIPDLFRLQPSA